MGYSKKYKLLLVDDSRSFLKALEFKLYEYLDGQIEFLHIARHGREAIEKMQQYQYDFVFMDIDMPILDGIETTRYLNKYFSRTRVVALSGHSDFRYVEKMIYAGAYTYILKSELDNAALEAVFNIPPIL